MANSSSSGAPLVAVCRKTARDAEISLKFCTAFLFNTYACNLDTQRTHFGKMHETDEPIERRSVLFCQRRVIFVSLVLMLLITVVYYGTSFR